MPSESRFKCGRRGKGCTPNKFFFVRWGTWLFDWTVVLSVYPVLEWFFTTDWLNPFGLAQLFVLVWILSCYLLARDEAMRTWLLGDMVSELKTDDGVERNFSTYADGTLKLTAFFAFTLWFAGDASPIPFLRGLLDWHYSVLTLQGAARMWGGGLVFYAWKDFLCFTIIHRAMHMNVLGSYRFHKVHHQGTDNLNIWNATTIDFWDNFIESAGIAFINIPVMWLLGWPIKMHMGSMVLTALADIQVHSVNPYTVVWFNPIMDYIFLGNVQHNLHHAKGRDHYTVVPWHHIFPQYRRNDIEDYNEIMNTAWEF